MNWDACDCDPQQLLEGSEPLWLAIYFGFIAVCGPPQSIITKLDPSA